MALASWRLALEALSLFLGWSKSNVRQKGQGGSLSVETTKAATPPR